MYLHLLRGATIIRVIFSHIALLYVDGLSHVPYLIEAHIERALDLLRTHDYLKDTKRRFMVLRLRADLPEMKQAPELPHLAAKHMFDAAQQHRIYRMISALTMKIVRPCSVLKWLQPMLLSIYKPGRACQPFREAASGNGFMGF